MEINDLPKNKEKTKIKYYIKPINICIKYNPPILALIYEAIGGNFPPKKYIHKFKLQIDQDTNVDTLYEDLRNKTPYYFNPKFIDQNQVINLLKSMKFFYIRSKEAMNNFSYVTENNMPIQSIHGNSKNYNSLENSLQFLYTTPDDNNLSIFDFCSDEKKSKQIILPVKPRINSESFINSDFEIKIEDSKKKCDNFQEVLKKIKQRYKYIDHSIFRNNSYEIDLNSQENNSNNSRNNLNYNSLSPKCQSFCINIDKEMHMNPFKRKFHKSQNDLIRDRNVNRASNIYKKVLTPKKNTEFFTEMEQVFVDDLKIKCWMDKDRNLYDNEKNFLGQAEYP